jgi:uncharacterized integral membrane protein
MAMKILVLINFIIIFFIALIFSVLNFHPVQINLYFTSFSMPLALGMTLELLAGIVIGILTMYLRLIKIKVNYSKNK